MKDCREETTRSRSGRVLLSISPALVRFPFLGSTYECGRVVGFSMASVGDSGARATAAL